MEKSNVKFFFSMIVHKTAKADTTLFCSIFHALNIEIK